MIEVVDFDSGNLEELGIEAACDCSDYTCRSSSVRCKNYEIESTNQTAQYSSKMPMLSLESYYMVPNLVYNKTVRLFDCYGSQITNLII